MLPDEDDPPAERFMDETLPDAPQHDRILAGDLITTTQSCVGKQFSTTPRSNEEIQIYADALADMLCAYLCKLQRRHGKNDRQKS
ncbi:TPA: hypothetical protein ONA86_005900 [Pseudomonas aeruginosa]|jgi:hypothetical protein|nr:hypothetical protein [Pseudomonas aeruginosa]